MSAPITDFDRAHAMWRGLAEIRCGVDVWRFTDCYGEPRSRVLLALVSGPELIGGVHVEMNRT